MKMRFLVLCSLFETMKNNHMDSLKINKIYPENTKRKSNKIQPVHESCNPVHELCNPVHEL